MASPLVKTKIPGVYKRGSSYAVIYRDAQGRQRQESARTYDEARRLRARRAAAVDEGSHQPQTRARFADYAAEWVERYQGRGRCGFREHTRADYRRDLQRYIVPQLGRMRVEQIGPQDVAKLTAWLCDDQAQGERYAAERGQVTPGEKAPPVHLADATVRRILSPLRACLSSAVAEGLIRHNPTLGLALPARDEQHRIDTGADLHHDDEQAKCMSDDELATFLAVCPDRWRPFFHVLAATGLRISEAIALRWGDVQLDGGAPHVHVRRACVRGQMGPPKSRHGRRRVPIDHELVIALRRVHAATELPQDEDLVFPATNGEPLRQENVRRRALEPVAQEAGVPWIGFHTFRHTCATRLFGAGRNAVQVQRWLGHHSPAFTLSVYVHLLNDDVGGPLTMPRVSARVSADQPEPVRTDPHALTAEAA